MSSGYVHGYASEEQQRLIAQAEHWRDDLILDGTQLDPGTRLLDVGCGVGAVLGILGTAFPGLELAGVDIEERQIETARTHLASLGLEADLRRADAADLPHADASFDHVWMMWFLEHVDDPVAVLREAHRVLAPGGELTAIEVDYNTAWGSPEDDDLTALFTGLARAMEAASRSDTGSRLAGWLEEAGFATVDPGERRLRFSDAGLARQVPYVAAVVGATIPDVARASGTSEEQLRAGLARLLALPGHPDATIGWTVFKARAAR